jgi:hypothetical protein
MPPQDHWPLSLLWAAGRHLGRARTWDLQSVAVTDSERARLLAAGVAAEPLQRFASWRRSTLTVVLGPTLLAALLATADVLAQGRDGLTITGRALTVVNLLALWAMPAAALVALRSWASLRRSHRVLLAGWAAAFLPPFLVALVPLGWWFSVTGSSQEQAALQRQLGALDVVDGLYVAFTLAPTALAILPGLVQACVRVKMLLPAAILPGWFLMVVPPFYLLIGIVALIPLNHLVGGPLLVLGALLWFGAPMLYVWRADLFVRPLPASATRPVNQVRRAAGLAGAAGLLLLLAYLFTARVFGLHLVGLDSQASLVWLWENRGEMGLTPVQILSRARSVYWAGDVSLSQLLVQYFGRSLFMTTVFADLLVRMNLSAWAQEKGFAKTSDVASYDAAMAELNQVYGRG